MIAIPIKPKHIRRARKPDLKSITIAMTNSIDVKTPVTIRAMATMASLYLEIRVSTKSFLYHISLFLILLTIVIASSLE